MSGSLVLSLFLLAFLGFFEVSGPGDVTAGGPEGKIIYYAKREKGYDIFLMNADGSGKRNLTRNPTNQGNPSFSPRGSQIVFQRDGDIWIMNLDGTEQNNLTATSEYEGCPAYSGDGKWIAFDTLQDSGSEIHIIGVDGSGRKNLSRGAGKVWNDACPTFYGPRKVLSFLSDRDGQMEIYVMKPDGSRPKKLTKSPATDMDPGLSPDGRRIVFTSNRDGRYGLFSIPVGGGEEKRLTTSSTYDIQPNFSPDGKWVVFERNGDIYTLNLESGQLKNLTQSPEFEGGPSWGP